MPFDLTDAFVAIQELKQEVDVKFTYLYEALVEKGIIKEKEEDAKKEKKEKPSK